MSRELKFRAWDKKNKKYTDDFALRSDGSVFDFEGVEYEGQIFWRNDQYIIEQFTGLKDENGKEWYVGELVKGPTTHVFEIIETRFGYGIKWTDLGEVRIENIDRDTWEELNNDDVVSIGNIHEHPELLCPNS